MAQTIPDKLPSKATKGELLLFDILKRLPDQAVVYHEPVIDNRHPDFVVILPELGVLLIEVKDWKFSTILGGDSRAVRLRAGEREVSAAHPLRQVRDYKIRLMVRCRNHPYFSRLIHASGPHMGYFKFPFGSFGVLSNITRDKLETLPQGGEVFPATTIVTRDQLAAWQDFSPRVLMEVMKGYFDPFWKITPMTKNQVDVVKAILHPEILLAADFDNPVEPDEPTVKILDAKQEQLARDIGEGHRLIFGVAGSGKTVLLMARAKLIARLKPDAQVLVLCYNAIFCAFLAAALKDDSTARVTTFHSWAGRNGVTWDPEEKDSQLGERLLARLKEDARDSQAYDAILIDEAQDFDSTWYPCVLEAHKDPVNGELLIVGDGSQGLYQRRKVSWKKLGIQAQGRTRYLEQNYRNTRPIVFLATRFASGIVEDDEEGLDAPRLDPEKCARVAGCTAVLLMKKSKRDEVDRVVRIVGDLLDGRWFGDPIAPVKPAQIGIIYRMDHPLIGTLRDKLVEGRDDCPVIWLTEKGKNARRRITEPGVKILTMHGSKGLQFKAVILLFTGDCPADFPGTTEADERRLFYVALTRAEDFLAISSSGTSKFVSEIEAAATP